MNLEENLPVKTGRFRLLAGILITVFIFAVGGVGGYWVGSRQQESSLTALHTSPKINWFPTSTFIRQSSPSHTIIINQDDSTAGWTLYKNDKYGFAIKYPARVKVEELSLGSEATSPVTKRHSIKFYSPEAAPNAVLPQDKEDAKQFADKYFLAVLQVYSNPSGLPLDQALKKIYSAQSLVPRKTIFELMKPSLRSYNNGVYEGLVFIGSPLETPQKSIFLSHKNNIFAITLYGGPDTGSNYSASAEGIFDALVSSLQLK